MVARAVLAIFLQKSVVDFTFLCYNVTMEKIGDKLKDLRIKAGLTQKELGDLLHVSRQSVSKWERNESYPDPAMFLEISKVLNVGVGELFYENIDVENIKKSVYKPVNRIILIVVPIFLVLATIIAVSFYQTGQSEYKNTVLNSVYVYNGESNVKVGLSYNEEDFVYVRKYFFDGRIVYYYESGGEERCFYEGVLYKKNKETSLLEKAPEKVEEVFFLLIPPIDEIGVEYSDVKSVKKHENNYTLTLKTYDNLPIAGFFGFSAKAKTVFTIKEGKISSLEIEENDNKLLCTFSYGYDFSFSLPDYVDEE